MGYWLIPLIRPIIIGEIALCSIHIWKKEGKKMLHNWAYDDATEWGGSRWTRSIPPWRRHSRPGSSRARRGSTWRRRGPLLRWSPDTWEQTQKKRWCLSEKLAESTSKSQSKATKVVRCPLTHLQSSDEIFPGVGSGDADPGPRKE